MAAKTQAEPANIDSRMAAFGIQDEVDAPEVTEAENEELSQEAQDTEEAESEEQQETADASSEESEVEAGEDDSVEAEENESGDEEAGDDEDNDQPEVAKLKADLAKEQENFRAMQSRYDRLFAQSQNQAQSVLAQIQEVKEQLNQRTDSENLDIADDEYVDGKTLKDIISKANQKAQKPAQDTSTEQAATNYLVGRKDYTEIQDYIRSNDLSADPDVAGIPTNIVGVFHAVRAKKLESDLKAMQDKMDEEVKKAVAEERRRLTKNGAKKPPPPTGGKAPRGKRGGGATEALSQTERQYANWMKEMGFEPKITTQKRG